jgi:Fe-S-cluster containining protein
MTAIPKKIRRIDVPAGDSLCDHCTAKCCKYFALGLDAPTEQRDWDFIRWFLLHDAASVFMEEGDWYLLVQTPCEHLQADNRCGIYFTRPNICREYSTDNCEYEDEYLYEQFLETADQVAEFMEVVLPRKKGESIRSPKPALLPVIG